MSTIEAILAGREQVKGHASIHSPSCVSIILRKNDHTYFTEIYCYTIYIYN